MIAGAIVESGTFPWGAGKHPLLSQPSPGYHDMNFAETFGEYGVSDARAHRSLTRRRGGAFADERVHVLQGLETLPIRMPAHVENARAVANFLRDREEVSWVAYAELDDSPYRALAKKYLPQGAGAIFTFGLRGGREAGRAFIEALELWSHLANVGDGKSLVIHPHRRRTSNSPMPNSNSAASGPIWSAYPWDAKISAICFGISRTVCARRRKSRRSGAPRDPRNGLAAARSARAFENGRDGRRGRPNQQRPSYFVFSYLRTKGRLAVAPINPMVSDIDGVRAFKTLADYAAVHGAPDIVDVFRKPADAPQVTREAIAVGAKAIWFQYGVINEEAIALADAAGLDVVVDRCIKVRIRAGSTADSRRAGSTAA